jgi:uncharacterized protein (DUF924 family)
MDPEVTRINDFWYSMPPKEWFMPPEGFDHVCNNEFGTLVQKARNNELDDWTLQPESTLALLVLLDQIPRNTFRGTPDAFSSDAKAFDIATRAIARGWDKEVTIIQALTLYLPLMHNERLISTVACLALTENLINRAPEGSDEKKFLTNGLQSGIQHRDVIARFGRYPSRNAILGRQSTKEEEEFLRENPNGFPGPKPEP